jgi:colanic acid/amylovoran biosynthesis glycosyltransferase
MSIAVLHSFPTWLPLTQKWMYDQIRFLPSETECHVVCEKIENVDQFGLPHIHISKDNWQLPLFLRRVLMRFGIYGYSALISRVSKKYRANILHSHFGNVGWQNARYLNRVNLKNVVSFYGFDVNFLPVSDPVWQERYREMFRKIDGVICEGPYMAKNIMKWGCPKEKIIIHHLGVAADEIPFKPRSWDPSSPLNILIGASFQEKKGIPYALEALGHIQKEIPLKITIIGDANNEARSQKEKRKIMDVIDRFNLKTKIRMLGFQPYSVLMKEAYEHHVFISPSVTASDADAEGGLPVTLIEMMASGMPAISTRHCDIPELIQNNETGLLSDERDIQGLVSNIRWLIQNHDVWLKMLEKARRHVEMEFNAKLQGKKLSHIYHGIIQS